MSLQIVLPGDVIATNDIDTDDKIILGPGLTYRQGQITAVNAGVLHRDNNRFWVDCNKRRVLSSHPI